MNLKHLYWHYFGYPDLPPRTFTVKTGTREFRYHTMARIYLNGSTIEEIAKSYNVTRERVRQCIWKVYWQSYKN